jgi:multidrug efflux pump subunit AcrB
MTSKKLISNFAQYFVKNFRLTIILLLAFLVLGYYSYTTFLDREGFPPAEVPMGVIQATYFVDDAEKVNNKIAEPLEEAISEVNQVVKYQSQIQPNVSIIMIEFNGGITSQDGISLIKDEIDSQVTLPSRAKIEYQTFNAGAIDGKHDMLISISSERESLKKIQSKAKDIATEFSELETVSKADTIEIFSQEINPITGEKIDYQSGINRVGLREDGKFRFVKAIDIGLVKTDKADILDLSASVKGKVAELKDEGELENIKVSYTDFGENLKGQISSLESSALGGLLAVVVILFLFIGWRSALVASIFIPTVMGATFLFLYVIGYSLNVLTLFSLILVLGLFVDDAIVVIESIDRNRKEGLAGLKAVKAGVADIGPADVAGTITTILVFLPMAFLTGILGDFIRFVPVTVVTALLVSILIALSIIPFFSNLIVARGTKNKKNRVRRVVYFCADCVDKLSNYVGKFVKWYLGKPVVAILIFLASIGLIGLGGYYAGGLDFKVFPAPDDTDEILIQGSFDEGVTVEQAEKKLDKVEEILIEKAGDQLKSANYIQSDNRQFLQYINLTGMDKRENTSTQIIKELKPEFNSIGKVNIRVEKMSVSPPTDEYQFFIQVFDKNKNTLRQATEEIKNYLKDKRLLEDGLVTEVKIDKIDSLTKINGKDYAEVKVKLNQPENTALVMELEEQLKNEFDENRLNELGLEKDSLGYDQGFQGQILESFNSAIFVLIIAIVLLYILLVLQFNSFSLPLLILIAVPFSFPLLFPALSYSDNAMSFFVLIGIISLTGIVVNNTIMLTDFVKRARNEGKSIIEAVSDSITIRFRPILITTITTIAALLPLLLTDPFWESMLLTIIFGLVSSMLLVLIAYPVWFAIIEKIRTVVKDYLRAKFSSEK